MTNKTELVSVPRELLEQWAERLERAELGFPGSVSSIAELRMLLAAPTEDVRAVVEEPVAYLTNGGKTFYFPSPNIERHPGDIPLYRRPQRPVVLPEPVAARDFANELISAAYEGGAFDAGDIQDLAVKHGLLSIEPRTEACAEACRCSEYGFPTECLRKTELLNACLGAVEELNKC